jgi:hypothetical protein
MAGSKWIYHTYKCFTCDNAWDEMVDRHEVPLTIACEGCETLAVKMPSGRPLKHEVAEKVHGGTVKDGKIIREYTGFKEMAEQNRLEKAIRRRKDRNKDKQGAAEAMVELHRKRQEGKKKL